MHINYMCNQNRVQAYVAPNAPPPPPTTLPTIQHDSKCATEAQRNVQQA